MDRISLDEIPQSMIKILDHNDHNRERVVGSGFVISRDGHIVTCHHCIYQLEKLEVEYQGQIYDAKWCQDLSDPDVDIAILKIGCENAIPLPIANPESLKSSVKPPEGRVIVYGFPQVRSHQQPDGSERTADRIQLTASVATLETYGDRATKHNNPWNVLPKPEAKFLAYKIDAAVHRGTSGGPVFLKESEESDGVVGVIQSTSGNEESLVIRWDNILDILDTLGLEPTKNAVLAYLNAVEKLHNEIGFFHHQDRTFVLKAQYIPIQVTRERRYKHPVESILSYVESEDELRQAYAMWRREEEERESDIAWDEAKKESSRIIVLADHGMGKTTLLNLEAVNIAQGEKRRLENGSEGVRDAVREVVFPILLRMNDLSKSNKEVVEAIPELICRDYGNIAQAILPLLKEKIRNRSSILLLDALDEVPLQSRGDIGERLNRFAGNFKGTIICTSGIVGYQNGFLRGASEMEIVPFSQQQIEQYIRAWFNNASDVLDKPSTSPNSLIRELRSKPQMGGLSQNPLLLSLLCSLYQEGGLVLPARRSDVYKKAVNYMLGQWSQNKNPQPEGRVIAKTRFLEELAYQFNCEGKQIISSDELYDAIDSHLQTPGTPRAFRNTGTDELMNELGEQDGIFRKLDREGSKYLFLHRTFQEHLAASYLQRIIKKDEEEGIKLAKKHFMKCSKW